MSDKMLGTFKMSFTQDGDSCSMNDCQEIEIEMKDAGGGRYFVIKTEEWAFDKPDELMKLLTNIQNAADRAVKEFEG